jgi:hypothetical protein
MKRALLLLALATQPALADDNWMPSVLGPYEGPVMNSGKIENLSTRFELDAEGHLIGHYHVDDVPPFDGDLTDFKPDGEAQGTFTWHDPYGQGVVHVRFDPDHGRFLGRWGTNAPTPENVFDGFRFRPPAVS